MRLENQVITYPYSSQHFSDPSAHVSAIASKSYALGFTADPWPVPWEGVRSWLTPTPVLPREVAEAALAGTGARSRQPWQCRVRQPGKKNPGPNSAWLLGDTVSRAGQSHCFHHTLSMFMITRGGGWNCQDLRKRRWDAQGEEQGAMAVFESQGAGLP